MVNIAFFIQEFDSSEFEFPPALPLLSSSLAGAPEDALLEDDSLPNNEDWLTTGCAIAGVGVVAGADLRAAFFLGADFLGADFFGAAFFGAAFLDDAAFLGAALRADFFPTFFAVFLAAFLGAFFATFFAPFLADFFADFLPAFLADFFAAFFAFFAIAYFGFKGGLIRWFFDSLVN